MVESHSQIKQWTGSEFPFDHTDMAEINRVHDILPDGYWLAIDLSADEDLICLMRWDDHVLDE